MSREHIAKIVEASKAPHTHGKWSRFCVENGLTKDAVWHWRKKLGLPMRAPKGEGYED